MSTDIYLSNKWSVERLKDDPDFSDDGSKVGLEQLRFVFSSSEIRNNSEEHKYLKKILLYNCTLNKLLSYYK